MPERQSGYFVQCEVVGGEEQVRGEGLIRRQPCMCARMMLHRTFSKVSTSDQHRRRPGVIGRIPAVIDQCIRLCIAARDLCLNSEGLRLTRCKAEVVKVNIWSGVRPAAIG